MILLASKKRQQKIVTDSTDQSFEIPENNTLLVRQALFPPPTYNINPFFFHL
jgi:hypothetical protein